MLKYIIYNLFNILVLEHLIKCVTFKLTTNMLL